MNFSLTLLSGLTVFLTFGSLLTTPAVQGLGHQWGVQVHAPSAAWAGMEVKAVGKSQLQLAFHIPILKFCLQERKGNWREKHYICGAHKIVWVGRDLQGSNCPAMKRDTFHQTALLKAPCSLELKNSNDETSLYLVLLNLKRFSWATSQACQGPPGWHSFPAVSQLHHSTWHHPQLAEGAFNPTVHVLSYSFSYWMQCPIHICM